jgi:hypothetical protein
MLAEDPSLPVFSPLPDIPEAEIIQNRDLAQYDHTKLAVSGSHRMDPAQIDTLRDFIWTHWKRRQRAYVRFDLSDIDHLGKSYIFIEPGDAGWHVIWRIVHYQAVLPPIPPNLENVPEIVSVERTKPTNDYWLPGSYVLVFRTRDGKEVHRL